jgi:hypothetical protein
MVPSEADATVHEVDGLHLVSRGQARGRLNMRVLVPPPGWVITCRCGQAVNKVRHLLKRPTDAAARRARAEAGYDR